MTYGVVFDYHMIQNAVETDTAEMLSYFNGHLVLMIFCTGGLPNKVIVMVVGETAKAQQNLLDIAQTAGADILWIDNNSGCKGVCERVNTINSDPKQDSPLS